MTTVQAEKIARRKLSSLPLAQELGNVSKACKLVGYSRQQFYEIRRNFQTFGAEGLVDCVAGPRAPHPNRVSAEVEDAILGYALEHPAHGPRRTADELLLRGIQVSSGAVRGVWSRHNLLTKHERPLPQRLIPLRLRGRLALAESRLIQGSARRALGDPEALPHPLYGSTPPRRAQKFPLATSFRIWLSSACSATMRFSRAFSFSSSRSRFASSAFIPPY